MGTGSLQHRAAQRGIGTCVKGKFTVDCLQDPVFIAAKGKRALHGVPLGMEFDGFLAGKLHLDRPAEDPRGKGGQMLDGHILFPAEPAADQLVFHHDPVFLPAQHMSRLLPGRVGSLVR